MGRQQLVIYDMPLHRNAHIRDDHIQPRRGGLLIAVGLAAGIWAHHAAHADEQTAPAAAPQISLDDLSATRERPLFSPSRRPRVNNVEVAVAPPPPPPPPPEAPAPAPNLTFLGTFESPTEVGAAVQIPPNDKPTIVRFGTYINGWRVIDISRHRLVLAYQDRKAVFTLFNRPGDSNGETPGAAPSVGQQFRPPPAITPVAPPRSR
jgi:general secretion pathway protein N